MIYPLAPNGVFWTIQGEGALLGEQMAFVRLAGCSVGCANCDTDYRVDRRATVDSIVSEVRSVIPESFRNTRPWVWITGGEPTDHNLDHLISACKTAGFRIALATAGVKPIKFGLVDWLSVSPHTLDYAQKTGHELKVIVGLNELSWDAINEADWWGSFTWRFIQPLDGDTEGLVKCVQFVLSKPGWRLGVQAHKSWNVL